MTRPLTPREKVALKPCPFCGGPEHHVFNNPDEYGRPSHGIQCANGACWISGPECETPEEAAQAWNRRAALASGSGDHAELYPNDHSAESWAKARKRWGYRIIRFEVEGPAYVS